MNQLFNIFQIMLASRPNALMDTFLVVEALSLVSQYVISSVNGIQFRIHNTRKCTCDDWYIYIELFTNKQTRGGLASCQG